MSLLRPELKEIGLYSFTTCRKQKACLDLNENCFPAFRKRVRTLKVNPEDLFLYSSADEISREIAAFYQISPLNILLTAGADDALRVAFSATMKAGETALLLQPAYSYYSILLAVAAVKIITLDYRSNFSFPEEEFLQKMNSRVKMVILTNPHNPLGTFIPAEKITDWLMLFPDRIFLIDETYADFAGCSLISEVEKFPNLLIVRSFSKYFGLAGLRIGFLVANTGNISQLKKVALPFAVSSLSQKILRFFIADKESLAFSNQCLLKEKSWLVKKLRRLGFYVQDSCANFLLLYLGKRATSIVNQLKDAGILLKDLSLFPLLSGFVRVSVGKRRDNLALLQELKKSGLKTALLFDLDGVLFDANSIYLETIRSVYRQITRKMLADEQLLEIKRRVDCCSDYDALKILLQKAGIKVSRKKIVNLFDQELTRGGVCRVQQAEKLNLSKRLLQKLARTFRLGIVTSRPRCQALESIKKFKLEKIFSVLITADETGRRKKPDPAGLLQAMSELQTDIAIYLGDHPADLQAASRAGIVAFAVLSEFLTESAAWQQKARLVVTSLANLEEVLL